MISYKTNPNISTQVHVFKYPDGCVDIDLQVGSQQPDMAISNVEVTVRFGDEFSINDTLIALMFTREALRAQYPFANIALFIPYLPYARQDRREKTGMAHPLKQIGKMINNMEFAYVSVADPHSNVAEACFDRLSNVSQYDIFAGVKQSWREWYIVAPDAGATKKCEAFAKRVGAAGVITCAKNRVDGKVQGIKVLDTVPKGANLFVLDDLCDKGGTFVALHNAINSEFKPESFELAITHSLYTHERGADVLTDLFNNVYTTDSFISDKGSSVVVVVK